MTYTAGSLIEATDYNGFVSTNAANVNAIWSTGSGDRGYGQSAIANVSAGGTVTATQWASLVNNISTMASHQGTTITSRTAPVAGNTIVILSAINTDITTLTTNRGNAAASGTAIQSWTGNIAKLTSTGSGSSAWTITYTHTITFASADSARYFFNAGGLIRWKTNKSSTGTVADTEWNDLATTLAGNIYISGGTGTQVIAGTSYTGTTKIGGTGTPTVLTTTTGFYDLTTTAGNVYVQFADTAPYTGQYIGLKAAVNSNSAPSVITLTTTWSDPGGSGIGSTDVITGGTDTASPFTAFGTAPATLVTVIPPSTSHLSNTWGTPTIVAAIS